MRPRPLSITIISWIFIITGGLSLIGGLISHGTSEAGGLDGFTARLTHSYAIPHIVHALAIVGGIFMLYGHNWARWLLVIWMAYHIYLSAQHSPVELAVHCALFGAILYFLFRPAASSFFKPDATTP